MKPQALTTPLADLDLLEIWDHIADDNVAAADRFLDRFDALANLLARFRHMGTDCDEFSLDLRMITVKGYPYAVFFRPTEFGVSTARVLHTSLDFERIFAAE